MRPASLLPRRSRRFVPGLFCRAGSSLSNHLPTSLDPNYSSHLHIFLNPVYMRASRCSNRAGSDSDLGRITTRPGGMVSITREIRLRWIRSLRHKRGSNEDDFNQLLEAVIFGKEMVGA